MSHRPFRGRVSRLTPWFWTSGLHKCEKISLLSYAIKFVAICYNSPRRLISPLKCCNNFPTTSSQFLKCSVPFPPLPLVAERSQLPLWPRRGIGDTFPPFGETIRLCPRQKERWSTTVPSAEITRLLLFFASKRPLI